MKKTIFTFGLVTGLAANLFAGETLRLKLEPDRGFLLSGSPQEVVVKIDLTAAGHKHKLKRTPLNLAVVLDRSGSMTGAKIEKARQAAMGLVDQLAPGDFFSLIAYSDRAEVLVPAQELEDKEAVKSRISQIRPGGSTALYAGLIWARRKYSDTFRATESIASSCSLTAWRMSAQARHKPCGS